MTRRKPKFKKTCPYCGYSGKTITDIKRHEEEKHGYFRDSKFRKRGFFTPKKSRCKSPEEEDQIICGVMVSKRHRYPLDILYIWSDTKEEYEIYTYLQDNIYKIEYDDGITEGIKSYGDKSIYRYRQCFDLPKYRRLKEGDRDELLEDQK